MHKQLGCLMVGYNNPSLYVQFSRHCASLLQEKQDPGVLVIQEPVNPWIYHPLVDIKHAKRSPGVILVMGVFRNTKDCNELFVGS